MLRFDTRSPYERVQRYIQERKFYTTLPHKLDAAEQEWLDAQLTEDEELWETKETGTFGQDGWSISKSFKRDD